jgi:hypothetical protein
MKQTKCTYLNPDFLPEMEKMDLMDKWILLLYYLLLLLSITLAAGIILLIIYVIIITLI